MNTGTNIRLLTFFAVLILAVSNVDVLAQSSQPPPCADIPSNATPEQEVCLRNACKTFRTDWFNCNGDASCQGQAILDYNTAIQNCSPVLSLFTLAWPVSTQHEWATIWYADGKYGVAFDLWDVPTHAVRFGF